MKKIFKALNILIKAKFVLQKPKEKKIIIFDKNSEIHLAPFFNKEEYTVLHTRYEILNLYILISLFFKFKKFNLKNYISENINLIKPKFIFTFIDNNISFYELKKIHKEIKFIAIQNGTRFITGDILETLIKEKKNYIVDYYFTFNQSYSKMMEKYLKGNYVTIGSMKNNLFEISKKYQKGSLCYISRMSDVFLHYSETLDVNKIKSHYKHWEVELLNYTISLIKNINLYCNSKNIKLNILGSSPNSMLEKNLFKNLIPENSFNFFPKKEVYDSYRKIDQFEVLINPMSTFGYEAIAREKKVSFFSGDFIEGSSFIWPLSNNKKGNFFSNSNKIQEVTRILDYLLELDDNKWIDEIIPYKEKLFSYDRDNSKFKNFLTVNGITNKKQ